MKNQLRAQISAQTLRFYRKDANRGMVACIAHAKPARGQSVASRIADIVRKHKVIWEQDKNSSYPAAILRRVEYNPVNPHYQPVDLPKNLAAHRIFAPKQYVEYGKLVGFPGFLQGLLDDPAGRRFLDRCCAGSSGYGSPKNIVHLYELHDMYGSPGKLLRQLRTIRWRADEILRPFGARVSWKSLGRALMLGPMRSRRAAFIAAALTVAYPKAFEGQRPTYRAARAALIEVSRPQRVVFQKLGISMSLGYFEKKEGAQRFYGYLVKNSRTGETFFKAAIHTTPRQLLAQAATAWREQRRAKKREEERAYWAQEKVEEIKKFKARFLPTNYSLLLYPAADGFAAGLGIVGTEQIVKKYKIPTFINAEVLIDTVSTSEEGLYWGEYDLIHLIEYSKKQLAQTLIP